MKHKTVILCHTFRSYFYRKKFRGLKCTVGLVIRHGIEEQGGTKVRRYNWHSAGSLGWPFPMLIYINIFFQIKYTETVLLHSTRKCYDLNLETTEKNYCVVYYNFRQTFGPCGRPKSKELEQRRRNGGGARPAMLKPRRREYLFAPAIFSHIFACCSLNFHSLSLCCLHTIKTSHCVTF